MTKTTKNKIITDLFIDVIEHVFPEYEIDTSESGGRIYFVLKRERIEYMRSNHSMCMDYIHDRELKNKIEGDFMRMEYILSTVILPLMGDVYTLSQPKS